MNSYEIVQSPEPRTQRLERAARKETVLLDPGRSIVGNAGVLLTRVEYLKAGEAKSFLVLVDEERLDRAVLHVQEPDPDGQAGVLARVDDALGAAPRALRRVGRRHRRGDQDAELPPELALPPPELPPA